MSDKKLATIKFSDGTTAKLELIEIVQNSYTPNDYWFNYIDGETNRQLVHPDYGKKSFIKGEVLLPEGLVDLIIDFEDDNENIDIDSFEYQLNKYLDNNFDNEQKREARNLFDQLARTSSKEYVINKYFKN